MSAPISKYSRKGKIAGSLAARTKSKPIHGNEHDWSPFSVFFLPATFHAPMDRQGILKGDAKAWYDVTTHIINLINCAVWIEKFLD
jgi:hypothetical protein